MTEVLPEPSLAAPAQPFPRAADTLTLLVTLFNAELGLEPGRVWRFNQRGVRPNVAGLQITVAFLTSRILANNNHWRDTETGLVEIENVNTREFVAISLLSVNSEAEERWPQVIAALQSQRAQRLMEENLFSIGPLPADIQNVSVVEGPAENTRYDFTVSIFRAYQFIRGIPYLIPTLPVALTLQP